MKPDHPVKEMRGAVGPISEREPKGSLPAFDGTTLRGGRCGECGLRNFPVVGVCSRCMSENIEVVELSRTGQIYAYSEVHVGPKKWRKPYVLGYVDLPEGLRILTRIVGEHPQIGSEARITNTEVGRTETGESIFSFAFSVENR